MIHHPLAFVQTMSSSLLVGKGVIYEQAMHAKQFDLDEQTQGAGWGAPAPKVQQPTQANPYSIGGDALFRFDKGMMPNIKAGSMVVVPTVACGIRLIVVTEVLPNSSYPQTLPMALCHIDEHHFRAYHLVSQSYKDKAKLVETLLTEEQQRRNVAEMFEGHDDETLDGIAREIGVERPTTRKPEDMLQYLSGKIVGTGPLSDAVAKAYDLPPVAAVPVAQPAPPMPAPMPSPPQQPPVAAPPAPPEPPWAGQSTDFNKPKDSR